MDSYATLEQADEYHAKRSTALDWSMFTDEQKQQRLVSASDSIDQNFEFKDDLNLKVREGEEAPKQLINATCEAALMNELVIGKTREKERVKVDVIEITYKGDNDSAYLSSLDRIAKMLKGLLVGSGNTMFFRTAR